MLVDSFDVVQVIDGTETVRLRKEIRHTRGRVSVALVRKHLLVRDDDASTAAVRAPLLLVHGFGQNRHAWHLAGRSFVNHLARAGYDVFNLDLRGHGRSRRLDPTAACSIDAAIAEDLPAAFAEVREATGSARVFLVGHSAGALVSAAFAGRVRAGIAGLVALAPPYRIGTGSLAMAVVARAAQFATLGGAIAGGPARLPLRGLGRAMMATRAAWEDPRVPMPLRAWHPRAFEPEILREYLARAFDTASLDTMVHLLRGHVRGTLHSADGRIDYGAAFESLVDVPLLVVAAHHDRLAPPASVRPMFERSHARDKRYHELPGGHGDLLLGRDAPALAWPLVTEWLDAHA